MIFDFFTYSALIQFFTVFKDYQKCDFYVTGEVSIAMIELYN